MLNKFLNKKYTQCYAFKEVVKETMKTEEMTHEMFLNNLDKTFLCDFECDIENAFTPILEYNKKKMRDMANLADCDLLNDNIKKDIEKQKQVIIMQLVSKLIKSVIKRYIHLNSGFLSRISNDESISNCALIILTYGFYKWFAFEILHNIESSPAACNILAQYHNVICVDDLIKAGRDNISFSTFKHIIDDAYDFDAIYSGLSITDKVKLNKVIYL